MKKIKTNNSSNAEVRVQPSFHAQVFPYAELERGGAISLSSKKEYGPLVQAHKIRLVVPSSSQLQDEWDSRLAVDISAGLLDDLAAEALADLHEGRCTVR